MSFPTNLKQRRRRSYTAFALPLAGLASLLSGCAVGPDFEPPPTEVRANWIEARDSRVVTRKEIRAHWWKVFKDPTLDRLVEIAYEENLPVRIAGLRIMEARAQLGVAVGSMFPQTQEGAGEAQWNKLSSRVANQGGGIQHAFALYNLGFDAGWELDFWGRFRRNVEASEAGLLASAAEYDNALVSLTAEVARTYTAMRTAEVFIALAHENAKIQKEGLDVALSRFRNGATSELDVAQARSLLESTLATIPQYQADLQHAKNALSVLLGRSPGQIDSLLRGPQVIPSPPHRIAIGVPAELLRRRPDVRAAELAAAAESARIGVAEADLYPRFFLFGEIGAQASNAAKLFAPGSLALTAGPGFKWSILNYGQITNNVRAQDARYQEALVHYQDTVLKAAQEAEDGLISFLKQTESAVSEQKSVEAAKRSVDLAMIQYREGADNYQRVIDAERFLLQEKNRYAETRSAIAANLIAVYKALGGGWELREGKPVVPPAMQAEMAARTNWGDLLPAQSPPTTPDLPLPTPAGSAPVLLPPDW
jgi:NodT family efflux transporter outer membrane factor (OMF) lipoprotein